MSNENSSASTGGAGLCTTCTVVFVILKLAGSIDWGWGWVLGPLWIPAAIVLGIWLLVMAFLGIGLTCAWVAEVWRNR